MAKSRMTNLRILGISFLVCLLILVGMMVNQHSHYADVRLSAVQDYQEAFHGDVFHVLTFVSAQEGQDFMAPLEALVASAQQTEATLIYAGQVIHTGLKSQQILSTFGPTLEWQAILLQQFDSFEAYQNYKKRPEIERAMGQFGVIYTHGIKRSAGLNVMLHQLLLGIKTWRQVTFSPDILPFQPSPDAARSEMSSALLEHADGLGQEAILIVNLARDGDEEQQAANASYGSAMLGLMADIGYGPMHIGSTVSLEHDHQFEQAMLVYYPGSQYFHDLSSSTWFQGIIGDKQLADTQACITVPITNLLLKR
ncbi:MAG: hypothetical protein AAF541_19600 [Pseudomonadota bacterium]